ncbi:uncharacterized protein [Dendrobates tinctorius]|uniref:uncharacterized protein isoform X1 n=1 Tax=Dendrobates tinctorius TaxID=92724 RepID=UPI003CC97A33
MAGQSLFDCLSRAGLFFYPPHCTEPPTPRSAPPQPAMTCKAVASVITGPVMRSQEGRSQESHDQRIGAAGLCSAVLGVMILYTEEQAKRVSVVGWVKNTPYGTVTGQVQGSKENVDIMKNWLSNVGSPMSRIDKTIFSNERQIQDLGYSNFQTKY